VDTISLEGIGVWAHHGVLAHEEELGQRYLVDVTIHVDLTAAAGSDDLADTVDYGTLAALVVETSTRPRAQLIESVAGRVAEAVLDHDRRIAAVDVTVHKPTAPLTVPVRDVSVRLTRSR
jgi:dihydroneopterin aldolase